MSKICIKTYGCTLNQADSDIMRALLEQKSYDIVESEDESDVLILNTCTVKGPTENRIFDKIKELSRVNKKFVVAGCITVNERKIRKYTKLAPILGACSIQYVVDAVGAAIRGVPVIYKTPKSKDGLPKIFTPPIARIPINDGCTSSCHFCQTKLARPRLCSYSPKTITKWINESVGLGAKEIQLTSMDLGAYGLDIKTDLAQLLEVIVNDDSQSRRDQDSSSSRKDQEYGSNRKNQEYGGSGMDQEFLIRLGMINPNHAKRMLLPIIQALKHPRFYKFIHIPVQTGSEKVCREMNRDHTVEDFVDIVREMRCEVPGVTIATDVIAGYPTETPEDFRKTKSLLKKIKPEIINVSKFSARPGTKAKDMNHLHTSQIKKRSRELSILCGKIVLERRRDLIGKKYRVLITEKQSDFTGRNINYIQVVVKDFKGQLGDYINVKITDAKNGVVFGNIEE